MIKFGPSGNELSFYDEGNKETLQAPKWLKERNLDCYEYSFGRGVNLKDEKAYQIGKTFSDYGIEISVHAPYYINLSNPDNDMAQKSYMYVIESAKKLKIMGGKRLVFHPATQGKLDRESALNLAKERMQILTELIYKNDLQDLIFCPETMGKLAQIGDTKEIVDLCKTDKIYTPCIDFGHLNSREQGSFKTTEDFVNCIEYIKAELPQNAQNIHVHFSKIEYGLKGELKHLTFADNIYGPNPIQFLEAVNQTKITPYVICESDGTQATDAVFMKNAFNNLLK